MHKPGPLLIAALCASCSSVGNTGRYLVPAALVAEVPWTNGVQPLQDENGVVIRPAEPVYPAIGLAAPDPGSRPVDCSGLADIELSPYWVQTFEPGATPNNVGVAEAWSAYDDQSHGSFHVPGDGSWYPGLAMRYSVPWGLSADRFAGPSCDGLPNDWALHVRGGRFNYYGGGFTHPLYLWQRQTDIPVPDPSMLPTCPHDCTSGTCTDLISLSQAPESDLCPTEPVPELVLEQYWDVSAYDGVAFWARRGPEGEVALLVALQNKYTSDDLARGNQTFCQRIKNCRPECANHAACTPDSQGVNRCLPEGADPSALSATPALVEQLYPRCGASACTSPPYFLDPDFDGTECKPYEFSGIESGYYCYGDEPPPAPADRCGDGFVAPVHLSTDWQLFKIPFSEFRQVGWGKKAPAMDLHSVAQIAFQFSVGFADVYVDNVTFYRNRR